MGVSAHAFYINSNGRDQGGFMDGEDPLLNNIDFADKDSIPKTMSYEQLPVTNRYAITNCDNSHVVCAANSLKHRILEV